MQQVLKKAGTDQCDPHSCIIQRRAEVSSSNTQFFTTKKDVYMFILKHTRFLFAWSLDISIFITSIDCKKKKRKGVKNKINKCIINSTKG